MVDSLTLADIKPVAEYLRIRDEYLPAVRALKERRKVYVGPRLWLTFENRETVIAQIQEMARVEHMHEDGQIQAEIDTYAELLPTGADISATLFIGVTDKDRVKAELDSMVGLNQHLWLELNGARVPAEFEAGRETATRVSAVQYVRFLLSAEQRAAFATQGTCVAIVVDHEAYDARTEIDDAQRAELAKDFSPK